MPAIQGQSPPRGDAAVQTLLAVTGVTKRFGNIIGLDDVTLDIGVGEFFCLLGASGCGKSTLLRLLAGFEAPDRGRVILDGADITDEPPHRRPLNMMFQSYALFPHLDVAANVAFGLKRAGFDARETKARVGEMLALVQLDGLDRRKPDQLSGGQRQRVALARALARGPRVLLLDEPLAALDRRLREETQSELKKVQARLGTTFLVVTHDQSEAMTMADRIAVMERGRIVQIGTPRLVYERPATRFVAGFLGDLNLVAGKVEGREGPTWRIVSDRFGSHFLAADDGRSGFAPGDAVTLAIRPERVTLAPDPGGGPNRIDVEVLEVAYLGASVSYRVRHGSGETMRVSAPTGLDGERHERGSRLTASFDPAAAMLLRD